MPSPGDVRAFEGTAHMEALTLATRRRGPSHMVQPRLLPSRLSKPSPPSHTHTQDGELHFQASAPGPQERGPPSMLISAGQSVVGVTPGRPHCHTTLSMRVELRRAVCVARSPS